MDDTVIRVEKLGKQYLVGAEAPAYQTFRETISSLLYAPVKAARSALSRRTTEEGKEQTFWALHNLSFEIKRGDVVGVIGSNGAGKSTLLKILSRVTEPSCGFAEIHGRVGSLLEVGTGFHPELSGRENIFLNGAILGMSQSEVRRQFDEIIAFAEVEKFLDMPVKRYSSGMYMRLAFSVAAHLEPDLLLVDEVLAVGDVSFQRKCLAKLKTITADSERTVLFVSHDMQAVQSLCKHALHLEHGSLVDSGEARSVIGRYLTKISSTGNYRKWDGDEPGNHEVRLKAIEVSSEPGSDGICLSSRDLTVTMVFDAMVLRQGLCIGFDILTPEGVTVLRSYQTDLAEDHCPILVEGTNSWQCTIPAGLLNAGEYYVSPKLSIHNQYWIVNDDPVIRFEVVTNRAVSSNRSLRPGILNPVLPWESVA
ncbi:MAG: hypothetical protein JWO80_3413 [Bryobacterales bacterium]|nr:hypothetical protein [Bryobacterales bacterium]